MNNKLAAWKMETDYCQCCGQTIEETTLEGFSIICPHCGGIS